MRRVLFIDNLDSFTFNLVESFERLGAHVRVVRNRIAADEALRIARETNALLVVSPGPGRPEDAGCIVELIGKAKGQVPLFGVCLGHQAMVLEAGGAVTRAGHIVHGKGSFVQHDGKGPLSGLPSPLMVGRYHSLCTRDPPQRFTVHAALDGMAMCISDVAAKQVGVQFHPESILTPQGDAILKNVLEMSA
jgi:anthranilate synthase/aminodeoxychorismate synthase-like glutamine amidotransferase